MNRVKPNHKHFLTSVQVNSEKKSKKIGSEDDRLTTYYKPLYCIVRTTYLKNNILRLGCLLKSKVAQDCGNTDFNAKLL